MDSSSVFLFIQSFYRFIVFFSGFSTFLGGRVVGGALFLRGGFSVGEGFSCGIVVVGIRGVFPSLLFFGGVLLLDKRG